MSFSKLTKRTEGFRESWNHDLAIERLGLIQCKSEPTVQAAPIFCCKFCPTPGHTDILAYADEEGKIFVMKTRNGQDLNGRRKENVDEIIASYVAHYNAIFDLAWSATNYRLISVSGDHAAHLWDVETQNCVAVFTDSTRSIKSAVFKPESNSVFAVGGRDGNIYVCDTREDPAHADRSIIQCSIEIPQAHGIIGSVKRKRPNTAVASRADSITNLCYQDENHLISCADGDGIIKIWDLRNIRSGKLFTKPPQPYEILKHPGNSNNRGFTSLAVDPAGIRLYANCYDSHIYCYNISTYETEPMYSFTGHEAGSYYVKITLSPDGRYLLSGSKDSSAYIWRVDSSPWPIITLPDHVGEVTAVAWSQDADTYFKVVACSDEPSPAIWRVETNIPEKSSDLIVVRAAQPYQVPESSKRPPLPNLPPEYQKNLKAQLPSSDSSESFCPLDCLPNFLYDKTHFLSREVKCRTPEVKKNWLAEISLNKQNALSSSPQPIGKKKPKKLQILKNTPGNLKSTPGNKSVASKDRGSTITKSVNLANLNLVTPDRKNSPQPSKSTSKMTITPNQRVTARSLSSHKSYRKKESKDSRQVNLLKYFQACSDS